jgi:hypothetical protein
MYITKVGELFIPNKTKYLEGVRFEYAESGPYLIFAFRNPSPKEIEAVRKGKVELALHETSSVLWILHRIEGLEQWSDCPFSIRLYDGMGKNIRLVGGNRRRARYWVEHYFSRSRHGHIIGSATRGTVNEIFS